MGEIMFGDEMFDHWLNQKSFEILGKVEKEKISTEDMLILSLKAQTNHFHHMDQEFRAEFKKIDNNFALVANRFEVLETKLEGIVFVQGKFEDQFKQVEKRFEQVERRFEQVVKRFEQVDKRFDRLTTILMWQGGILTTLITGIYFKLFALH
jgi:chaperonin cofactor prefoldin